MVAPRRQEGFSYVEVLVAIASPGPDERRISFEGSVIVSDAEDRRDDCRPVAGRGPRESVVRGR